MSRSLCDLPLISTHQQAAHTNTQANTRIRANPCLRVEQIQRCLCTCSQPSLLLRSSFCCSLHQKSPIYLRSDLIPWLIAYALDEHHYQDAAREKSAPVPTPSKAGNSPAVADLLLSHEFQSHAYWSTLVAGPFAGIRKSWKVDDISADIWNTLKAIGVVHASASRNLLKARRGGCK